MFLAYNQTLSGSIKEKKKYVHSGQPVGLGQLKCNIGNIEVVRGQWAYAYFEPSYTPQNQI